MLLRCAAVLCETASCDREQVSEDEESVYEPVDQDEEEERSEAGHSSGGSNEAHTLAHAPAAVQHDDGAETRPELQPPSRVPVPASERAQGGTADS